jgi:hypothetical protein
MNDKITISPFQLFHLIPDQGAARLYLEAHLRPKGAHCRVCGLRDRISTHRGTIFERSHVEQTARSFEAAPRVALARG